MAQELEENSSIINTLESTFLSVPLNGRQDYLNFKGVYARKFFEQGTEEKVGVFRSRTRLGRAAQAVGSYALPGDTSKIRKPVRSTIYGALTPGGGGGIGSAIGGNAASRALRCPVGFEFGGRFATRGFSNCGRQLFELPGSTGLGGAAAQVRGAANGLDVDSGLVGLIRRRGERVTVGRYGSRAVQIERATQIPRVGGANNQARIRAVEQAISDLASPDKNGSLLVRRDGSILRPTIGPKVLSTIRKNPDMNGGTLVSAARTPSDIGKDSTPSLWISDTRSVAFALPGGGSISLERNRDLTTGDRRKLSIAWAKGSTDSNNGVDYGLRLRKLADESNGSLVYSESFPQIDKPNDLLTVGEIGNEKNTMSVRRWVYATFLADNAPGRGDDKKWKEQGSSTSAASVDASAIGNLTQAVRHLDSNGDPSVVPSDLLDSALNRSKAYRITKIRPGVSIVERGDGKRWYRVDSTAPNAHLAERVSSDVHSALGLQSPPVTFLGSGANRSFLVAHPENLVDGKSRRDSVLDMNEQDLLRVGISDWLLDQRDRSPASFVSVGGKDNSRVIATSNVPSALIGLSSAVLEQRRRMVLADYMSESRNEQIARKYAEMSLSQRKAMLSVYNDLLKRATEFNWDDYVARLGVDGKLSSGEKQHLEIVRTLYTRRLEQLKSSRQRYLSIIGVQ